MRGMFARLCVTCISRFSQVAVDVMLQSLISFVATWYWNQTRVQEMRGNFVRLLQGIRWLNRRTGRSNPTVNQFLRQLEDQASEGIELLDGEPTPLNLQNARRNFERIRSITQDLTTQVINSSPQIVTIKSLQFKPRYLHRRTRFQVLTNWKVSSGVELQNGIKRFKNQLFKKNAITLINARPQVKPPQFKSRHLFRRTRFQVIAS